VKHVTEASLNPNSGVGIDRMDELVNDMKVNVGEKFRHKCRTLRSQRLKKRLKQWNCPKIGSEWHKWFKARCKYEIDVLIMNNDGYENHVTGNEEKRARGFEEDDLDDEGESFDDEEEEDEEARRPKRKANKQMGPGRPKKQKAGEDEQKPQPKTKGRGKP
jgi:hypothetical protein